MSTSGTKPTARVPTPAFPPIPHSSSAREKSPSCVAVGVNPQSGSHRHNADAWPHQRNPLFYLRRFLTQLTEIPPWHQYAG